jgi:glycosyltransferase involved in cell wall biosynthesis
VKSILITARLYGAAGVETHLLNLCSLLVREGASVTLASRFADPGTPLVKTHKQIPIRLIATPFAGNLRLFRLSTAWALLAWGVRLRREQFDVLYSLELTRFTRFLASFVKRDGYVLWNRAGLPPSASEGRPPGLDECLDGLIVESPLQAEAVREAYRPRIPVIALPHLGHTASVMARRDGHRQGLLRVCFLGRYARKKGIYRLLDLWPTLAIQPAELYFYGHGDESEALRRAIAERRLQDSVRVNAGWSGAGELSGILEGVDLVVLPSEEEGLPGVLLEAMAHGIPFVAADVGAVRTLAEDNQDVRVVPLDNRSLKEAIEDMADRIRSGRTCPGRLQEHHRARFGYEVLAPQWKAALLNPESVWGRRKGGIPSRSDP